jgi:hypothetical protein
MFITFKKIRKATFNMENLNTLDKAEILKNSVQNAKEFANKYINYEELRKELNEYNLELPNMVNDGELGKMHVLYAKAQSYHSRISTIEMLTIQNCSNWKRVTNYMESFMKDIESKLLISEEAQKLSNSKTQEAFVRTKTEGIREKLTDYQNELEQALTFKSLVAVKKKDIYSILENVTRQVKLVKNDMRTY